jgi:hypothetical protein
MKELSPEDRHDRAKVNEAVRQAKESGTQGKPDRHRT